MKILTNSQHPIVIFPKKVIKLHHDNKQFQTELWYLFHAYSNWKFNLPKIYSYWKTEELKNEISKQLKNILNQNQYYIAMENLKPKAKLINFSETPLPQILQIYTDYRKRMDGQYFPLPLLNIPTQWKLPHRLNHTFPLAVKKFLFQKLALNKAQTYISNASKNISKIPDKYHKLLKQDFLAYIFKTLNQLFQKIRILPIIHSHWWFWKGHLWQDKKISQKYYLIDWENAWLKFWPIEAIGVLRSHSLLYNFKFDEKDLNQNLEEFKNFFLTQMPDENLYNSTLLFKLIGTIYQDYMVLLINNLEKYNMTIEQREQWLDRLSTMIENFDTLSTI